ncbi:MAG: ATP-binding cassette domain-containing protein [Oscillospiraceae bacterium]
MIKFTNVDFSYGNHPVLKNFSLEIPSPDRICLFGKSGIGKTTVLRLIAGLEVPCNGAVVRPNSVSFVFQEDRLLPNLSVIQNILLPCNESKKTEALDILSRLGLSDAAESYPDSLSGGMSRRVALARALLFEGEALLLDEPFNGLDSESKKNAAQLILERFYDKPIVMVTHSEEDILLLGARAINIQHF